MQELGPWKMTSNKCDTCMEPTDHKCKYCGDYICEKCEAANECNQSPMAKSKRFETGEMEHDELIEYSLELKKELEHAMRTIYSMCDDRTEIAKIIHHPCELELYHFTVVKRKFNLEIDK